MNALKEVKKRRVVAHIKRYMINAVKSAGPVFNDFFTRHIVGDNMSSFLSHLQSKQAIHNYKVICDETNNTPSVIDSNRINLDVIIQPSLSCEYININLKFADPISMIMHMETIKMGFVPGRSTNGFDPFVAGVVGIQSGFVCEPSIPTCEPFFVLFSGRFILCDGSYRYFAVDGKSFPSNDNYTTGDMEIIDRAINKYVNEN
ncbi:MAG: hypothetical protein GF411_08490 [Candidatus Lokiarchaeota archaeon]|nr:hypothetical protein [Candidatus Lokiarchaeota archaeon]